MNFLIAFLVAFVLCWITVPAALGFLLMLGEALREIGQDRDVLNAVYETLEVERLLKGSADITLIPEQSNDLLLSLLSLRNEPGARPPQPSS